MYDLLLAKVCHSLPLQGYDSPGASLVLSSLMMSSLLKRLLLLQLELISLELQRLL